MKAFLVDMEKCIGCYACQIGCKDEHCGNEWLPYAKSQPDIGQFWLHLYEEERDPQMLKAEEWITDDEGLTKNKKKLSRVAGKFRRKTIDRKDYLFNKFAELLK